MSHEIVHVPDPIDVACDKRNNATMRAAAFHTHEVRCYSLAIAENRLRLQDIPDDLFYDVAEDLVLRREVPLTLEDVQKHG